MLSGVSGLAIASGSGPASAASLVLDGVFDSGYQLQFGVTINGTIGTGKNQTSTSGLGSIGFGIDSGTGNEFFYFKLPTNYVDNTYGSNSSAGWTTQHQFSDLLGSDVLGNKKSFQWTPQSGANSGVTQSGQIDYIATDNEDVTKATTYRSGGFGEKDTNTNNGLTKKNDGGLSKDSSTSDILGVATSLEYDLNVIDSSATTDSSTNAGWIDYVGYELVFKPGTFNPSDWLDPITALTLVNFGGVHASPSMFDITSYDDPVCTVGCSPSAVPIPPAAPLFAGGLGLLSWLSRKKARRKKKAAQAFSALGPPAPE